MVPEPLWWPRWHALRLINSAPPSPAGLFSLRQLAYGRGQNLLTGRCHTISRAVPTLPPSGAAGLASRTLPDDAALAVCGQPCAIGVGVVLKIKDEPEDELDPPAVRRIHVFMIEAGMVMLAVSLVVQYFRLVH